MHISIIIPTYNEEGAIGKLLDALIRMSTHAAQFRFSIIVVDANSPDSTQDIVRQKAKRYKNIHLIPEKEKRGIAPAYLDGMRFAIHTLKADAYIEFDGDGQHNPDDIPLLLKEFVSGYDYVIGSRYVPGGTIPQTWSFYRKFLSRFGGWFGRWLLELQVHDVTSGFKLSRIHGYAEKLPLSSNLLLTNHYAYKIQLLHEMILLGARTKEVPINFLIRKDDVSKSTWRDIVESLRVVMILRLKNITQWKLLRVALVGGVGFIIQTIIFETIGIQLAIVPASIAVVIGAEAAIISNFFLNNRFTFFENKVTTSTLPIKLLRFHLVSSGSVFLQWLFVFTAESVLSGNILVIRLAYILGITVGFIFNYTCYHLFIWNKRHKELDLS